MPILELTPNPAPPSGPPDQPEARQPVKLRTGRFSGLEEHELIHLLDSIDDEVARARFRESIYKSIIICMVVAWFLFYGPRVLFHQPEYRDPIALMKEHDKELTYTPLNTPAPRPPAHPVLDKKTIQQLQRQQPRVTAPAPAPAPQQAQPAPQPAPEQVRTTTAPPVPQAPLPQPTASKPVPQPLVDAPSPRPQIAQNNQSAGSAMDGLIRGSRGSASGPQYGSGSPARSGKDVGAGAAIISDTQGVDFSAYLRRVVADTQRNWDPLIPEEVRAPLYVKGIVGIRFTIRKDGSIGDPMVLETRSGNIALDHAAWNAITSEGAYPPLPPEFHGSQIELRFGFYYNLKPDQK